MRDGPETGKTRGRSGPEKAKVIGREGQGQGHQAGEKGAHASLAPCSASLTTMLVCTSELKRRRHALSAAFRPNFLFAARAQRRDKRPNLTWVQHCAKAKRLVAWLACPFKDHAICHEAGDGGVRGFALYQQLFKLVYAACQPKAPI